MFRLIKKVVIDPHEIKELRIAGTDKKVNDLDVEQSNDERVNIPLVVVKHRDMTVLAKGSQRALLGVMLDEPLDASVVVCRCRLVRAVDGLCAGSSHLVELLFKEALSA